MNFQKNCNLLERKSIQNLKHHSVIIICYGKSIIAYDNVDKILDIDPGNLNQKQKLVYDIVSQYYKEK
ncbi:hypothetical protein BpHYR1_034469 [Brachionus plicatilis]|uniref:Uncharacterized protein n=1 Tax=Brachionus plicatilis TaxID=10195 RepID=A0A3M7Q8R9_BRAPC|nr:hypothetical protein BpHYR1_034469 [Brachionus plicatilis]